jgi:hypothetical protein
MSWDRLSTAPALADALNTTASELVSVFDTPPPTLNPPALVVGRPVVVRYSTFALGVDEVELPVVCLGPLDGEVLVNELSAMVRTAVVREPTLGGTVKGATAMEERNWRSIVIAGTSCLAVDVILSITA